MNIFNMTEIIAQQSQSTKDWIALTMFLILPLSIILISAIARIFCKRTLIVTGAVLTISLLINLIFFRDIVITLLALIYYFVSFLGCFVTLICEMILNFINKKRGKTDVDAYGRPRQYTSGAMQGKKQKNKKS